MVTTVPVAADAGLKDVIDGAGMKVNPALEPIPVEVTTLTSPVAPPLTVASISCGEITLNPAEKPPKVTDLTSLKF